LHPRLLVSALTFTAAVACRVAPAASSGSPAAPAGEPRATPPSRWAGAAFDGGRVGVTVTEVGEKPRRGVLEPPVPGRLPGTSQVTDVAYDTRRGRVYVATCCEPGSGRLRSLAWGSGARLADEDQGFAVDVAGASSTLARADAFGTFAVQLTADSEAQLLPEAGVADVAVAGGPSGRVFALVDTTRLRALVATPPQRAPALLVMEPGPAGWTDTRLPLPEGQTFCRLVPLHDGTVGLLAGAFAPHDALRCVGERLDSYDTGRRRLQAGVLSFPEAVRHLSVDESSTFLIFTTVAGAVGWRALDGRGGTLAPGGFAAADW
jgi:hypothetical protein